MNDLSRFFFDFPRIEKRLLDSYNMTTYPPFNSVVLKNGNHRLEFALPGFSKDEVEVRVLDGYLTVEGKKGEDEDVEQYINKGLSHKHFRKTFRLSDDAKVSAAKLENGLLFIELEKEKPIEKEPLLITIED